MQSNAIKYINQAFLFSLYFIAVTFPLPYKISNIGLGLLVVSWIAKHITLKQFPRYSFGSRLDRFAFFAMVGFFIWNVVSLLYTYDVSNGWKNVESKLTLFVLPIVFFSIRLEKQKVVKLCKAFVYSISICTIVLLIRSVANYFANGSLLTYHDFTAILDFHAVFYSYDLFLSILIVTYLFQSKTINGRIERIALILSLVLFFAGLIISASKNVLVVTTLFLVLGFVVKSVKSKFSFKEVLLFISIFLVAGVSFSLIPSIKGRISELVQLNGMENLGKIKRGEKLVEQDIREFNGTSLRITFWNVAINKQIKEGRVLLGYSPGDRRAVMNAEYLKNGINPWYENYNLHNQFVQSMVELGLIGLALYLLFHISFLIGALRSQNWLMVAFVIGVIFFQLTESIIERNKGIVFLVYFLLLLRLLTPEEDENRHIRD